MLLGHRVLPCGSGWPGTPRYPLSPKIRLLDYRDDFTVFMLILIFILRMLNGKVIELFSQFAVIIVILPYMNETIYKTNVIRRTYVYLLVYFLCNSLNSEIQWCNDPIHVSFIFSDNVDIGKLPLVLNSFITCYSEAFFCNWCWDEYRETHSPPIANCHTGDGFERALKILLTMAAFSIPFLTLFFHNNFWLWEFFFHSRMLNNFRLQVDIFTYSQFWH